MKLTSPWDDTVYQTAQQTRRNEFQKDLLSYEALFIGPLSFGRFEDNQEGRILAKDNLDILRIFF